MNDYNNSIDPDNKNLSLNKNQPPLNSTQHEPTNPYGPVTPNTYEQTNNPYTSYPPQTNYGYPEAPYTGQAPYATAYTQQATTNTFAIISFISSITAFFFGITALAGIIFGHIALKQIRERGEGGRGFALAGLIMGYVFTGLFILSLLFIFTIIGIGAAAGGSSY